MSVLDDEIDRFLWHRAHDRRILPHDGLYASAVFPGLWLDINALLASNMLTLQETVQRGLEQPEHHAFVESLRAES